MPNYKTNNTPHKIILLLIISFLIIGSQYPTDAIGSNSVYKDVSNSNLVSSNIGGNSMDGEAVDIDNDGDMDMILAMEYQRNVILINDGKGKLVDQSDIRFPNTVHDSEDLIIRDFDKDGDLDIIFVSEDDRTNEFYINKGDATFSNSYQIINVSGTSNVIQSADFNKDTYPDILIGNRGQNFLLINDSKGGFINETESRLPGGNATTQDIELKDIDADGDLDIIEANETNNRILINNGLGIFYDDSNSRLPKLNDQTREVELSDIDNDGDLDIFFANVDFGGVGNPQNRLLLNDGKGFFNEITDEALPKSPIRTVGAVFFDINNDGYPDLISGNRFNELDNMVLINNQYHKFIDKTKEYFPQFNIYPFDFHFADFNNDNLMDLYLCNFRGKDKLFIRNSR